MLYALYFQMENTTIQNSEMDTAIPVTPVSIQEQPKRNKVMLAIVAITLLVIAGLIVYALANHSTDGSKDSHTLVTVTPTETATPLIPTTSTPTPSVTTSSTNGWKTYKNKFYSIQVPNTYKMFNPFNLESAMTFEAQNSSDDPDIEIALQAIPGGYYKCATDEECYQSDYDSVAGAQSAGDEGTFKEISALISGKTVKGIEYHNAGNTDPNNYEGKIITYSFPVSINGNELEIEFTADGTVNAKDQLPLIKQILATITLLK